MPRQMGRLKKHFYKDRQLVIFNAIPEDGRKIYVDASKGLKEALCPEAIRENYFTEFES